MKNQRLFLFFVAALCSSSYLVAQSVEQNTGVRLQAAGLNNQSSSPLMMFGEDEKSPTDATSNPRTSATRDIEARGAAATDSSSSDMTRGTASGLAEEREDESLLTLENKPSSPAVQVQSSAALLHGGLSNNRADCFINSAVQLCKAFTEELDPDALGEMPYFATFLLSGRLRNDEECRALREEMAAQVIKENQDLQGAIKEGTAQTHQDVAAFLRLLLAEAKAPELFFKET